MTQRPSIMGQLELALFSAFFEARARRQTTVTVEHVLWVLLADRSLVQTLQSCDVDTSMLARDLEESFATIDITNESGDFKVQEASALKRLIQRALVEDKTGRAWPQGPFQAILTAIVLDGSSHAAHLLARQGFTETDIQTR